MLETNKSFVRSDTDVWREDQFIKTQQIMSLQTKLCAQGHSDTGKEKGLS